MRPSVLRQIAATEPVERGPEDSVAIDLSRRGDVLVIRPLGALGRAALPRVRRLVLGAGRPVVLDLDECVLVDPTMLAAADFDVGDEEPPEIRIVSGRLSCRRLLARVGVTDRYFVHASVDDAVHAMPGCMRTGVSVSTADDGRHVASLALTGHLCNSTRRLLEEEVARLVEDGIAELDVELRHIDTCLLRRPTAVRSGLPAQDGHGRGTAASSVVDRVLAVVAGADPGLCRGIAIHDVQRV